jgi:hypothetical protein
MMILVLLVSLWPTRDRDFCSEVLKRIVMSMHVGVFYSFGKSVQSSVFFPTFCCVCYFSSDLMTVFSDAKDYMLLTFDSSLSLPVCSLIQLL